MQALRLRSLQALRRAAYSLSLRSLQLEAMQPAGCTCRLRRVGLRSRLQLAQAPKCAGLQLEAAQLASCSLLRL